MFKKAICNLLDKEEALAGDVLASITTDSLKDCVRYCGRNDECQAIGYTKGKIRSDLVGILFTIFFKLRSL